MQVHKNDFEWLGSATMRNNNSVSVRLKWYGMLLLVGFIGSVGCLWAMFYTSRSEALAHKLGMSRVANSLENILDLLAYPVLMFMVVLMVYASQRLYQLYKLFSDPKSFRRK